MKKLFMILAFLLLPGALLAAEWKEISPQRVQSLLTEGSGLWLIDVRAPQTFERMHIEGAVNIPSGTLALKRFPAQKILVVADNSLGGLQARDAAQILVKNGQQRVFVLAGGIAAWQRENLPLVGETQGWELARVLPGELQAALAAQIPLEIIDLRDPEERRQAPLAAGRELQGRSLAERVEMLKAEVAKRGKSTKPDLAGALRKESAMVVVLPVTADAVALYQQQLRMLPMPVRVVEGAYLVGSAQRQTQTAGECPTCPK